MGLFRSTVARWGIDSCSGWWRQFLVRPIWEWLCRLDASGRARRFNATAVGWSGITESGLAANAEAVWQLRTRYRVCVAGSMVWRWPDNGSWRLSTDLPGTAPWDI